MPTPDPNEPQLESSEDATGRRDPSLDALIAQYVPSFPQIPEEDQIRLREIAANLQKRNMPPAFVSAGLRSTADVLREMRREEEQGDNILQREHVRRFIEQNAVTDPPQRGQYSVRRERKREERERLQANIVALLREARLARGRHEVKKTRNMLLKIDQREVRRQLGKEGDELCRQINTWLRSTASMF